MSLFLTIARSANKVIRELLECSIVIIYILIIPLLLIILVPYRIVSNTACISDLIWIAIAIVVYGIQMDLFTKFEQWLGKKLGT